MDFDMIINSRRSARLFSNDEVLENDINKILSSGILARSARNRQPWKFYILNDIQKNHIMNMLLEWDKTHQNEKTSVKGTANQIRTAHKMIMVYSDSRILCDTLYLENEIYQYLEVTNYEQICGFIVGNPIYNYPTKIKKNLNSLLLN